MMYYFSSLLLPLEWVLRSFFFVFVLTSPGHIGVELLFLLPFLEFWSIFPIRIECRFTLLDSGLAACFRRTSLIIVACRIWKTIRSFMTSLLAKVALACVSFALIFISTTFILVAISRRSFGGLDSFRFFSGSMLFSNKEFFLAGFELTLCGSHLSTTHFITSIFEMKSTRNEHKHFWILEILTCDGLL